MTKLITDKMKKLSFLLLAALTLTSCNITRLAVDTKDEEGSRVLYTNDSHVFDDVDIALGAKIDTDGDTLLAVIVTYEGRGNHSVFEYNGKMMFRLTDGSVITLTNMYKNEFEKDTETYTTNDRFSTLDYAYYYDPYSDAVYVSPYEVSHFIPRTHTRLVTRSYGLYLISKHQLQDIIDKKVIKFRVETESSELDMTSGAGKVSAILAEQFKCLQESYSHEKQRSEF